MLSPDYELARAPMCAEPSLSVHHVIDSLLEEIGSAEPFNAGQRFERLLHGLELIRRCVTVELWEAEAHRIRGHSAFSRIQQLPLNRRAFEKPRGYAGDAVMIDMIYEIEPFAETDPWIRSMYDWSTTTASYRAVNSRRTAMTKAIESAAAAVDGAAILSIACGHARELALVGDALRKDISQFACFDQDPDSLARIERDYPRAPLMLVNGSVLDILRDRVSFGRKYDLIYVSGLYDYLDDRVARALTAKLTEHLSKCGKLSIANFSTDLPDIGYMESILDWRLVYRTASDMLRLVPNSHDESEITTARSASANLVWLEIAGR